MKNQRNFPSVEDLDLSAIESDHEKAVAKRILSRTIADCRDLPEETLLKIEGIFAADKDGVQINYLRDRSLQLSKEIALEESADTEGGRLSVIEDVSSLAEKILAASVKVLEDTRPN